MLTAVKKWGNSASIRIPSLIMDALKLNVEDAVDIREEGGRIVIVPVTQEAYTLENLLSGITPDNIHERVDFGVVQGKELL